MAICIVTLIPKSRLQGRSESTLTSSSIDSVCMPAHTNGIQLHTKKYNIITSKEKKNVHRSSKAATIQVKWIVLSFKRKSKYPQTLDTVTLQFTRHHWYA